MCRAMSFGLRQNNKIHPRIGVGLMFYELLFVLRDFSDVDVNINYCV